MQLLQACTILYILLEHTNGSVPINEKCQYKGLPLVSLPHSSLIERRRFNIHPMSGFTGFTEYTIKPGVDQLIFNCSYQNPIIWMIYPQSSLTHSKVDFYVDISDPSRPCFTTTVTLSNKLDENLSGAYTCGWLLKDVPFQIGIIIDLYSRSARTKSTATTSDFGIDIPVRHPRMYTGGTREYGAIIVPCAYNYQRNLSVFVTLKHDNGKEYPRFERWAFRCLNVHCISLLEYNREQVVNLMRRNGATFLCQVKNDSSGGESRLINILPDPKTVFIPTESKMTLLMFTNEYLIFTCRSTQEIAISTDFTFEKVINTSSNTIKREYYTSQADLKIITPDLSVQNTSRIEVVCTTKPAGVRIHTWEYTLAFGQYALTSSISIRSGRLVCFSKAPSTVTAFFVPCSTFNDCQMKSKLIYTDQAYQLTLNQIYGRSAEFNLSELDASSGLSGMGRCVGFMQDLLSIFYTYTDRNGVNSWGPLNGEPMDFAKELHTRVSLDKSEVLQSEFVIANYTTPLMLVITHPVWLFDFRNKSTMLISQQYITETNKSLTVSSLFMSTRIQIPSLEIIGISCSNEQFVYISPFVWEKGIFLKNANDFKTHTRRISAPIKVTQIPNEDSRASIVSIKIGAAFGMLFILASIIAFISFYKYRLSHRENERIRQEEIDQFKQGNPGLIAPGNSDNPQNTAYDNSVEIDSEDLDIDYQSELGSGQFGIVYKGTANHKAKPLAVAVKTMKPGASVNYVRAMMAELKVMLYIKIHTNVVRVIGACTNNLIEHHLFIILEFCPNGDLHSYLRKSSERFINFVTNGTICPGTIDLSNPEYMGKMTSLNLIKWSSEIANGMAHISKLNVIHGDLAARNILLDQNLVAKISDFGLSKQLYQYSLYVRKRAVPVPWRWLAVESLAYTEFSSASDVWSYGVTLWEIFSLGTVPYPGQEYNQNFVQMLRGGFRLPLPEFATYEIYNIILGCWKNLPAERPKFDELKARLDPMLNEYIPL